MGGAAAIAGALGPTIAGALTAALSWRAVLLVNCPLAAWSVHSAAYLPLLPGFLLYGVGLALILTR